MTFDERSGPLVVVLSMCDICRYCNLIRQLQYFFKNIFLIFRSLADVGVSISVSCKQFGDSSSKFTVSK